jgi:hypothetical protein
MKKNTTSTKKAAKKPNKKAKPITPALVLRTCNADGTSHGGFVWPASGPVECADWNPEPVCGGGLHGLLWGEGDWSLMSDDMSALWQVVSVDASEVVAIDSAKVKFPRGGVLYTGSRAEAITRVLCSPDKPATKQSSGNSSTAASSGDYSTAASSGDYSTAASSGYYSTAASSGDSSKAASSGNYSTAASSGYSSIAMAAGVGTVSAGKDGCIATAWFDGNRYHALAGDIGTTKDGNGNPLQPDTPYRAVDGKWVRA